MKSTDFATTHWSLVISAGAKTSPESTEALAALCSKYWYPLYAFARRRLANIHDAQDRTQEFFAQLLAKKSLQFADRERGRFRSFLLASFKHFLSHEQARAHARKRGGGRRLLSIDFAAAENRFSLEPTDKSTPEAIYERRWALTLLEQVFGRLRAEYAKKGKEQLFEQLKPALSGGESAIGYSQLAVATGTTEGAIKVAVHRLRQRYGALLRETIAETLSDPDEVDDEVRQLFRAVSLQ
jgi:RNA polymerase sigma-70 factor (ECF subfamily)